MFISLNNIFSLTEISSSILDCIEGFNEIQKCNESSGMSQISLINVVLFFLNIYKKKQQKTFA